MNDDTLAARVAKLEKSEREWYARWKAAAAAIDERDTLKTYLATARGLLSDLRRPYLPDGAARAVEAAVDAFLAGQPVEGTLADALARLEELEDIGEDLCIHLGAFVGDECPSMDVMRRWDAATGQNNADANIRAARAERATSITFTEGEA